MSHSALVQLLPREVSGRQTPSPRMCHGSLIRPPTGVGHLHIRRSGHSPTAGLQSGPAWKLVCALGVLGLALSLPGASHGAYPASVTGFYTDNAAQQTVLLEQTLSPKQKKEIRNEILQLLGLEHKPRVRGHMDYTSVPEYMLELYRSLGEDPVTGEWDLNVTAAGFEDKLGGADLIMGFVNQARIQQLFSDGGRRFYFDFSEVTSTEVMTTSQLRIYKYTTPWMTQRGPFTVNLYKIKDDIYRLESVLEPTYSTLVHGLAGGWLDMDTSHALKNWVLEPEEHVLMYLQVTDKNGVDMEPSAAGFVDSSGPQDKQAFLLASFKATHKLRPRKSRVAQKARVRRSPAPTHYYSDEKDYHWKYPVDRTIRRACRRKQLQVSFKALGWESWVIAPEGYPAFYCEGTCTFPLNAHMNATNHAIVQALVHLVKPFLAPNPCCAPTTLTGISFLYLDNSYNVVLKQYKNMVVQACGCH